MSWKPKRSLSETDKVLCATGALHELETRLIDGRLYRVYKNLWPSLRSFWLSAYNTYSDKTYIVFEEQRLTYRQVHDHVIKTAAVFRDTFDVRKGDRVGICSRNCPEYIIAFWACHFLGAVAVLVNAWLPLEPLRHCLVHTECKLVLLDSERANQLAPIISKLSKDAQTKAFLVFETSGCGDQWNGIQSYHNVVANYRGDPEMVLKQDPCIIPEDDSTIIFTSGTTGLPKGVLSSQRMFLTNVLNVLVGSYRAALRNGADIPLDQEGPQKGVLVAVPLFHVTGSTSFSMFATMRGFKIVLTRKWIPEEAARLIREENISVAGGVPTMVSDLLDSSLVGYPLEGLLFGGSPAPDVLPGRAKLVFPAAMMIQGYGLTETNSIAVSIAGEDYTTRPTSTGLASPVNDILIMNGDTCVPPGHIGEVWLRGPNIMKGYWRDPEATRKAITSDGWFKTGDRGNLDEDGFLHIRDRVKDLIIRGGENIDCVTIENALYKDPRISEAVAVGVPDRRLGELVAAVVAVKPGYEGQVTEASLISLARKSLPKFAVPVMIVVQRGPFERTPSEKIIKGGLRKLARQHWEQRQRFDSPSVRL